MTPDELLAEVAAGELRVILDRVDVILESCKATLADDRYNATQREAAQWVVDHLPEVAERVEHGGPLMLAKTIRLTLVVMQSYEKLWNAQLDFALPHLKMRDKALTGASKGGAERAARFDYGDAEREARDYAERHPGASARQVARHVSQVTGISENTLRGRVKKWIGASH